MSFIEVRTVFRERLEALGYEEHDQPFDPNAIGNTIIDGSFHMQTGFVASGPANQQVHSFNFPIVIRVYRRGHLDVLTAYDNAHVEAETILADILDPSVRIGGTIKDIVPDSIEIQPLDASNDNIIVIEFSFTARLECDFTA